METCNFCPTLHRSVGQSGGPASGAGAFFKSRRPCGGGPAFPPAGPPCKLIRNEECFLNQTANYQLPLWEKQDRILMEDFNSLTERSEERRVGKECRAREWGRLSKEDKR